MICAVGCLLALLGGCVFFAKQESPTAWVEQFLTLEQQGDYGSSWEKLHPEIQHRWPKETYIQLRAKIFMDILGARNFVFETGKVQALNNWTSPLSNTTYTDVTLVPTKLTFTSPFGTVTLLQNYYVVQADGRYSILWDIPPDEPGTMTNGKIDERGVTVASSRKSS